MGTKDNPSKGSGFSGGSLILIGVILTATGVFSYFLLYFFSQPGKVVKAFAFLGFMFLPIGLLTTLVGSVIWSCRAEPGNVIGAGLGIAILALLSGELIPFNPHDWTVVVLLVFVTAILIAGLFFIFGFARLSSR